MESIDVLSPGNVSYSLYTHGSNNNNNNRETHRMTDTEIVDIYPSELVFFNSIIMIMIINPSFQNNDFLIFRQKEEQKG